MNFELPNLAAAKRISLDIETRDPDLLTRGSAVRRDGYIVGIAVSVPEGQSWYVPFAHERGFNFDPEKAKQWALDNLCNPNQSKIGANIRYDLDYLFEWGVPVSGPFLDIQVTEPLLNENRSSYSLENLGRIHIGRGKYGNEMDLWVKANLGKREKVGNNIWRIPSEIVSGYAKEDATLTQEVFEKQEKLISDQGLTDIFQLETKLIPMLLAMKKRGVRVNTELAEKLDERFAKELIEKKETLKHLTGKEINHMASASIAEACDKLGYSYPLTAKTKAPSFTQDWMAAQDNEFFNIILELRKSEKYGGTFIKGTILNYLINDRIHSDFNQLRSEKYGAVSGRFSSSNPNLQFTPKRDKDLGKLMRSVFIADEDCDWFSFDYKAIEPRITLHYAKRQLAAEAIESLNKNPDLDIYQTMMDRLPALSRDIIKTIYLGATYGMGINLLAKRLNCSVPNAKDILDDFYKGVPYVPELNDRIIKKIEATGFIETLLKRRRRFELFEPRHRKYKNNFSNDNEYDKYLKTIKPLPEHLARKKWGFRIKRYGSYKGLNALIQGSAADVMKKSMVDLWESGIFDETGAPSLTVHDELDFSIPKGKRQAEHAKEIKSIMENTIKLRVPLIVDMEKGPSWGELN
jgi:DNA polymerase I-like protein with 3'-5' exonuclease and polymerase domains